MDVIKAILATIGLLFLLVVCYSIFGAYTFLPWTVLLTASWAAWDYEGYEGDRFITSLPRSGLGVFFLVGLLWPIGFPLYLAVRERIWAGKAPLRAAFVPTHESSGRSA